MRLFLRERCLDTAGLHDTVLAVLGRHGDGTPLGLLGQGNKLLQHAIASRPHEFIDVGSRQAGGRDRVEH